MLLLIVALFLGERNETSGVTCGERCVYGTVVSLSHNVTLAEVRAVYRRMSLGEYCSLADLTSILDQFGVRSVSVTLSGKDIQQVPVGSILHLNGATEHFVIYGGLENGNIVLLDLPLPATMISEAEFLDLWSGNALFVSKDQSELAEIVDTLDRNSRIESLLSWLPLAMCLLFMMHRCFLPSLAVAAMILNSGCSSKDVGSKGSRIACVDGLQNGWFYARASRRSRCFDEAGEQICSVYSDPWRS